MTEREHRSCSLADAAGRHPQTPLSGDNWGLSCRSGTRGPRRRGQSATIPRNIGAQVIVIPQARASEVRGPR